MVSKKLSTKKDKVTIRRTIAKLVIMPILLLLLWLILSLLYINNTAGITVLLHDHGKDDIVAGSTSELLEGEKIHGEFEARENNLGIVAVRFNTFLRINDDVVIFRIKEKGSRDWYYENTYTTPQFQPNDLFTFGFPVIPNSQGKTYVFEIESLEGEPSDAVALSPIEPVFVTKYQYSREMILSDNQYALNFFYHKSLNALSSPDFLVSSFIYALPLILYVVWLFYFEKYLSDKYFLPLIPIALMITVSIVDLTRNDTAVIGLTLLWAFFAYAYTLKSTLSLVLALLFILFSPLLLFFGINEISKNSTMWGYLLLVVGVIQAMVELKTKDKKLVGLSEFAHKLGIKKK